MQARPSTAHRLGFAVKVLGDGGLPSHDARRWARARTCATRSSTLTAILEYLDRHDIRMYRMATALAPYASHPDLPQFHDQIGECERALAQFGEAARARDVRLSTHPGQYTVLNSERPDVRAAAVAELEVQAALLDAMGLGPEAVVVLHVGGTSGGIDAGLDRFVSGFEPSPSAPAPGSSSRTTTAPSASWMFCGSPSAPARASCGTSCTTAATTRRGCPTATRWRRRWRPGRPARHRRSTSPRRAWTSRCDRCAPAGASSGASCCRSCARTPTSSIRSALNPSCATPPAGRDFDIMLEAKAKDVALLRLRAQLDERGLPVAAGRVIVAAT